MLKKSGKKLKTLSKLIMAIGFCISTFCGCFTVASAINNYQPQGAIFGIFILAGGVFFAWVAALLMYGFGELVEQAEWSNARCRAEKKRRRTAKEAQERHAVPLNGRLSREELGDVLAAGRE